MQAELIENANTLSAREEKTLNDLHRHLFAQLERLSIEELKGDALTTEVTRSDAVVKVSLTIIANVNTMIKGRMSYERDNISSLPYPPMLGIKE